MAASWGLTGLERNFVSVLIGVLVFIFETYDPDEAIGLKSRIGWKRWTGREKEFVRCPVCILVGAEGNAQRPPISMGRPLRCRKTPGNAPVFGS